MIPMKEGDQGLDLEIEPEPTSTTTEDEAVTPGNSITTFNRKEPPAADMPFTYVANKP